MNKITGMVLWGGTGQARVIAELIAAQGMAIAAVVDRALAASPFANAPLLADETALAAWLDQTNGHAELIGAVAIGGSHGSERRRLAAIMLRMGLPVPRLVHARAWMASDATVAEGAQILAGARLCTGVRVGSACIVNTGASIDHDCVIEDGAHIGPGAVLAGEVSVGMDAFVGTGAVVLPRLSIGRGAIVGAGAVVTRNVQSGTIVVGNPARPHVSSH